MEPHVLSSDRLVVTATDGGAVRLDVVGWPGLRMEGLTSGVRLRDGDLMAARRRTERTGDRELLLADEFEPGPLLLRRRVHLSEAGVLTISSELSNASDKPVELADVRLLEATGSVDLGRSPEAVRVYEQASYWARTRRLGAKADDGPAGAGEPAGVETRPSETSSSENVWVGYDAAVRMALLVGFETGERWTGRIRTVGPAGAMPSAWSAGFDGGLTRLRPGSTAELETLSVECGPDPWELLERYGDRVAARHGVRVLDAPPVSWCAWYPYRLGITDERALATARVGAQRLRPLGLRIIELDLGWERGYLPSAFEENEQFPRGLRALADDLERDGFVLGAWKGPFTVSAHDPVAAAHPEWLLRADGGGAPEPMGEWYWEPHGETFCLDLTHPDALAWLRERMRSLARRGVRYFKPDFIGGVTAGHLTGRHDRDVVAGGGSEAIRRGMETIREALFEQHADPLVLNCGGPDIPGTGAFPLLYTCNDTGNTGYVGWNHLKDDYGRNVAGHLWKNGRWGVIQPSCMVVGPPGSLEEGRLRATATFLAGGQVDIGDDLTVLPEDRWQVLLATLPPLGRSARPVDLFEPIPVISLGYDALARGLSGEAAGQSQDDASRVWVLPVEARWDAWHLVGLFNYDTNDDVEYGKAAITRYLLPLDRLGLDPTAQWSVHEFWSGQYLGTSPFSHSNPRGYRHPGDAAHLISSTSDAVWEVAFFGPGVRLLVVRRARAHPWPAATTFHQSGGAELADVVWDGRTLSGILQRPEGQTGLVIVASTQGPPREALVGGRAAPCRMGANGSVVLPIVTPSGETPWEMRW